MGNVLKSKRKESQFEVFHYFYGMRKEITNSLLVDFGFSMEKARKKISKQFGNRPPEELDESEKAHYDAMLMKDGQIDEWFIKNEREAIIEYLRQLGLYMFSANEIYPQCQEELTQRRICQERALGYCEMLSQELQYAIETLPVDINKYTRFSGMIEQEKKLIKAWRASDNKLKKGFAEDNEKDKK